VDRALPGPKQGSQLIPMTARAPAFSRTSKTLARAPGDALVRPPQRVLIHSGIHGTIRPCPYIGPASPVPQDGWGGVDS